MLKLVVFLLATAGLLYLHFEVTENKPKKVNQASEERAIQDSAHIKRVRALEQQMQDDLDQRMRNH
jgi:hypothetical protein